MPVEHQAAILYAAVNGYLDDVELARVRDWESRFHQFLNLEQKDWLTKMVDAKDLTEELENQLKKALEEFKKSYI